MMVLETPMDTRGPVITVFSLLALSSFGFFLIFPYLALYITLTFGPSPTQTGAIVGVVTLTASGGAWLGGMLADRFGVRLLLMLSSLLYAASFLFLFAAGGLAASVAALLAVGLARMLMEPALKAALVQMGGAGGRLFRLRYLTLVVAASVAPLCIAFVPMAQFSFLFLVVAALYFACFLLGLSLSVDQHTSSESPVATRQVDLPNRLTLGLILLSGLIFLSLFAQFETTLSLHLARDGSADGARLYRYALIGNALAALAIALWIEARNFDTTYVGWISTGVLSLSAAALCLFASDTLWVIAVGVLLFSVGEVLLFPLPDIFAARLAKPGSEGRMMGLIDLRYFGFFAGPTLGGFALTSSPVLLATGLSMIALSLLPIFLLITWRLKP